MQNLIKELQKISNDFTSDEKFIFTKEYMSNSEVFNYIKENFYN